MKSIEKKIAKLSKTEVEKIENDAKLEAKKLEDSLMNKATLNNTTIINKAINDSETTVEQKKRELELYEKQAVSQIQREIVDGLYGSILEKMNSLKGDELLKLILALLKDTKYLGTEELRVAKRDYDKFLDAVSSETKTKKVDCDKLNKQLKTKFYLTTIPADVKSGFVLVGDSFDLSFDYKDLLELIQDQTENEILEKLF